VSLFSFNHCFSISNRGAHNFQSCFFRVCAGTNSDGDHSLDEGVDGIRVRGLADHGDDGI